LRRDLTKIADFRKNASGIFLRGDLEPADAIEMLWEISLSGQAKSRLKLLTAQTRGKE
jgi:hypothetical protein